MTSTHLASLSAKHAQLDQRIASETQRPMPDSMLIARLKREKLRLKEEMGRSH